MPDTDPPTTSINCIVPRFCFMVRNIPTKIDGVLDGRLAGVYTCLFFEAGYIMLRKRKENVTSGRVSTVYQRYVRTIDN